MSEAIAACASPMPPKCSGSAGNTLNEQDLGSDAGAATDAFAALVQGLIQPTQAAGTDDPPTANTDPSLPDAAAGLPSDPAQPPVLLVAPSMPPAPSTPAPTEGLAAGPLPGVKMRTGAPGAANLRGAGGAPSNVAEAPGTTDVPEAAASSTSALDDRPLAGAHEMTPKHEDGPTTDTFSAARSDAPEAANTALPASADVGAAPPSATTAERGSPLTLDAKLPVHAPQFREGFAQQVTVLVEHGIQHARMSLNPSDLGPVEIRITVQHDEATVQLASPHNAVREAMNEALPRLRELLEQSGVRLADTGVFTQLPQREQSPSGGAQSFAGSEPPPRAWMTNEDELTSGTARVQQGLVDAYV